jgi:WD40 repeat protein/uncharacterized caspase-like protein
MKRLFSLFAFSLCSTFALAQDQNARLVIPIGHTDGITSIDLNADGHFALTGSLDQTARLWDWGGREILSLTGHTANVLAVAFSPATPENPEGGKLMMTGGSDHRAILWDTYGKKIAEFSEPAENGEVVSVAIAASGKEFAVALKDGTFRLLNDSCREIARFTHRKAVNSVAFSPDGQMMLAACSDNNIYLWKKSDTARPLRVFSGHAGPVACAVFSANGTSILSGSADGNAILWKISGEKIKTLALGKPVRSVALSADAQWVAAGSPDGTAKIWDIPQNKETSVRLFGRGMSALKFKADAGALLASSDVENAAVIYPLNGTQRHYLKGQTSGIVSMALSKDGGSLLVGHADSSARLWSLPAQNIESFRFPERIESVAVSPEFSTDSSAARIFLAACENNYCVIQNLSQNNSVPLQRANRGVFSLDGKYVLTGHHDGTVQHRDLRTGKSVTLQHAQRRITALAFSPAPDSRAFAIGSYDGAVVYWDSAGAQPFTFNLSSNASIHALAFSADGKQLVCGNRRGLTEIREIGGKLVKSFPSRRQGIQDIRAALFLPSGKKGREATRVLRSAGNQAEIWDVNTGEITVFKGHASDINALAVSPKGDFFFSGSSDGTIKIWDIASGKEIATMVSLGATDWAITTPHGLYDASPAAMKMMHYVVDKDVVLLRQIKERYWDPGLLGKTTGWSQDSMRQAPQLGNVPMYPEIKMEIKGNQLEINLKAREGGLGRLSLYINGIRKEENINPDHLTKVPPINLDQDKYMAMYRADQPNTIGVVAYNAGNWLRSPAIELPYRPVGSRGDQTSGNSSGAIDCNQSPARLFIISVGTSKYLDATKNLAYPDHDAAEIAKALGSTGKAMFREGNVQIKLLSTAGGDTPLASKKNIQAAFEEIARQATPCDALVVYFSGHGSTWGTDGIKKNFYYLTHEISSEKLRDDDIRNAHAISDVEMEKWMNGIRSQKKVLIIDACHSGQAASIGIGQRDLNTTQAFAMGILNDRTGAHILTGSLADMVSFEASKYGQGLLTYSILRGLTGPGLKEGKFVDVLALFQHARNEVPLLAKSIKQTQTPVIASDGDSFPIGLKDSSVHIVVAAEKPVFIQSKFINTGGAIKDTLGGIGLGQALNDYFFEQRLKGPDAKLVFYDIPTLSDGYSIQGTYSKIEGNQLFIIGNLFKGENPVGEHFELKTANSLKEARTQVLKVIMPRVTR